MTESAAAKYARLNTAILLVVASYAVLIDRFLSDHTTLPPVVAWILTLLSSGGLFRALVAGAHALASRSAIALQVYLGSQRYWRGYWHYTSELNGVVHLGVWRIDQDLLGTRVYASGLDENFSRRFTAFSVSDVAPVGAAGGVYEVVNARNDYSQGDLIAYSRTRFTPERPTARGRVLRGPSIMRGETVIFGSGLTGNLHRNVVLVRHDDVDSEESMIEKLRQKDIKHGVPVASVTPDPVSTPPAEQQ